MVPPLFHCPTLTPLAPRFRYLVSPVATASICALGTPFFQAAITRRGATFPPEELELELLFTCWLILSLVSFRHLSPSKASSSAFVVAASPCNFDRSSCCFGVSVAGCWLGRSCDEQDA